MSLAGRGTGAVSNGAQARAAVCTNAFRLQCQKKLGEGQCIKIVGAHKSLGKCMISACIAIAGTEALTPRFLRDR